MKRTIGTIVSDGAGVASLIHDSEAQTLVARYGDGREELVGDWYPTSNWREARKQVIAMYGNQVAYHDTWVLCLRPVGALRVSRSEG